VRRRQVGLEDLLHAEKREQFAHERGAVLHEILVEADFNVIGVEAIVERSELLKITTKLLVVPGRSPESLRMRSSSRESASAKSPSGSRPCSTIIMKLECARSTGSRKIAMSFACGRRRWMRSVAPETYMDE
jgi:hypothetical protein